LQKLINLRQGKGTRSSDQIPLRAMTPVFINEYQSRADYYDEWLKERVGETRIPQNPEQKLELLIENRIADFQKLCDVVYEKKRLHLQKEYPKRNGGKIRADGHSGKATA